MTKFYWVRWVSKSGRSIDKAFDTKKEAEEYVIKGEYEVTNEFKFESIKRY